MEYGEPQMKMFEATQYFGLREEAFKTNVHNRTISAGELAEDIFAEAAQREQPFMHHSPETWRRKWLPSKKFHLMMIPLNAAALPCDPKGQNLVLKKIHAREEKPIIVDYNRNQVGASMNGFVPQVIVIDGKHRFKAAAYRGDTHIMAWVGEVAVETLQAFGGGGGGGPAPERTTPASGASLVAKKTKVKAQSKQETRIGSRENTTYSAEGMATKSEKALRVSAKSGYLKNLNVDKIKNDFEAACAKGYKPKLHAVHPPGCEDAVTGLKKKYGDSDSTYKIAWWMKDQGRCG
jgi:hypothetical protein